MQEFRGIKGLIRRFRERGCLEGGDEDGLAVEKLDKAIQLGFRIGFILRVGGFAVFHGQVMDI